MPIALQAAFALIVAALIYAQNTEQGKHKAVAGGEKSRVTTRRATVESLVINSGNGQHFLPAPGLLPECFSGALQRMDLATGRAVFLIRNEASTCIVPWHWHRSGEQITVVSGTVFIGMRDGRRFELGAGGYAFLPARHVHLFGCKGPCVHFVQSEGPFDIRYVDERGKEITLDNALELLATQAAAGRPASRP